VSKRGDRAASGAGFVEESGVCGDLRWRRRRVRGRWWPRGEEFFLGAMRHGVRRRCGRRSRGNYHLDGRDARCMPRKKQFPLNRGVGNVDICGEEPGQWVKRVNRRAGRDTVREHQRLCTPARGYKPRLTIRGLAFSGFSYMDYATPIRSVVSICARHRLEKKEP